MSNLTDEQLDAILSGAAALEVLMSQGVNPSKGLEKIELLREIIVTCNMNREQTPKRKNSKGSIK